LNLTGLRVLEAPLEIEKTPKKCFNLNRVNSQSFTLDNKKTYKT
jgi:hypothetical protein